MVGLAYFFTYNFLKQYLGKFLGYLVHDGKPILCCCKFDIKSKPGAAVISTITRRRSKRSSHARRKASDLSDRVWRYTDAFKNEIELGLDLGIRSGKRSLRFYDPQNGMSGALDLYTKDIAGNVRIYRVDNLAPNANIVKDVLTKGETKAAAGTAAQGGISGGIETKAIFERAKQIKSLVQRDGINPIVLPTLNKTAEVSIKKVKEWCNQPHRHIAEKNELILHIRDIMAKAKYVGCGIDKHDHTCIAHLYEIEINGDPSWVVFREYRNGKMQLHGTSDSPDIDIVKNVTKK